MYCKNFTIVNDDHKWGYNLERHSRVMNYAPRGVIYDPRCHELHL